LGYQVEDHPYYLVGPLEDLLVQVPYFQEVLLEVLVVRQMELLEDQLQFLVVQ
jgi:hypothetical protein